MGFYQEKILECYLMIYCIVCIFYSCVVLRIISSCANEKFFLENCTARRVRKSVAPDATV